LTTGGPVVMVWGWVVVACFTFMIGLAMAEITSAHPTCGGPYYWAAVLSKPHQAPFASWITGWFNFLGQVAITMGISWAMANFLQVVCTFGNPSFVPTENTIVGIYAAILVAQGLINTFGVHLLKYIANVSVAWHILGTLSIVIATLSAAPKRQTARFVFTQFVDLTGIEAPGWGERASHAYIVVIGILVAQYTLIGYDASAHMTEETHNAAMSGPLGILMAIGVSAILGWYTILGLLFSIQDFDTTVATPTKQPVAQIFLDTVGEKGAIVLMVIIIMGLFLCGIFSVLSNSRMMYAFARDGGFPGHKFFHYVHPKTQVPVRTVWLACTLSFILGLPSFASAVAFTAATSITTIGLYISYGIPIALRVLNREDFKKGPFHLGRFSYPIAIIAIIWICFISVAFVLPQLNPVTSQTFNYASVAVGVVLVYSIGFWLISARKWFKGPIKYVEADGAEVVVLDSKAPEITTSKSASINEKT